MGSKEFPAESEYGRYIEGHGGYANAYTTTDHTAFYFDILPHGLLGALDRISQFFTAPVSILSSLTNCSYSIRLLYRENAKQSIQNIAWENETIFIVSGT